MICGGRGWLPFWSEAERAGLKAIGDGYKMMRLKAQEKYLEPPNIPKSVRELMAETIALNIRSLVRAARRVKEGK